MSVEFQVNKQNLLDYRVVETEAQPLADGEIRLKVDQFAFTANNLTYGAAGDQLGYWQFFPASEVVDQSNENKPWGLIPVWAFADAIESNNSAIAVGERLYGYFPPAAFLDILPKDVNTHSLTDGAEHRQTLPPLYNRYRRVLAEPNYDKNTDLARILLAPLHMTSFCICDQLEQNKYYGAEQIIIVSASSKTSIGVAFGLSLGEKSPSVIGLTSNQNMAFVDGLSYYQQAISYPLLNQDLKDKPSVVIDMAGNTSVKNDLRRTLGDKLIHYINVGLTHWDDFDSSGSNHSSKHGSEEMFFAPSYILQRLQELGSAELDRRSTHFVAAAAEATFGWMNVDQKQGLNSLSDVYPSFCNGTISPDKGLVIKM